MRMVADAVAVEPVSASKFPDMREFAGNFCNFQGIWLERRRKEPPDRAVTAKFPYATDQRIFRSGSGILEARAANLLQP